MLRKCGHGLLRNREYLAVDKPYALVIDPTDELRTDSQNESQKPEKKADISSKPFF